MDLKTQLVREEGRRNVVYLDTLGVATVGIGHVEPGLYVGEVWTDAQIDAAFDRDVATKTAEVTAALPWFAQINEARQAVLLQMAFQMGTHGLLQFKQTLAAVRDQRWSDAAGGMLASVWAKQTKGRANRLARQMETGDWQ
jgi:lysozyme